MFVNVTPSLTRVNNNSFSTGIPSEMGDSQTHYTGSDFGGSRLGSYRSRDQSFDVEALATHFHHDHPQSNIAFPVHLRSEMNTPPDTKSLSTSLINQSLYVPPQYNSHGKYNTKAFGNEYEASLMPDNDTHEDSNEIQRRLEQWRIEQQLGQSMQTSVDIPRFHVQSTAQSEPVGK
jgi:hypothetical protein